MPAAVHRSPCNERSSVSVHEHDWRHDRQVGQARAVAGWLAWQRVVPVQRLQAAYGHPMRLELPAFLIRKGSDRVGAHDPQERMEGRDLPAPGAVHLTSGAAHSLRKSDLPSDGADADDLQSRGVVVTGGAPSHHSRYGGHSEQHPETPHHAVYTPQDAASVTSRAQGHSGTLAAKPRDAHRHRIIIGSTTAPESTPRAQGHP
jgi:hypothetical protein